MSISASSGAIAPRTSSNTLRVPKAVRRYCVSTPEKRRAKALCWRDRSLEFSLYEFVLRVRAAEEGRISVDTVQNLSSRIKRIFHTKEIVHFQQDHIRLDAGAIRALTQEFEDLGGFASGSKEISFEGLKRKGWDLHSLSQSIEARIHNAPEFFDRKIDALMELEEMDEVEELGRERQKMDPGHEVLNIILTAPSGETKVLVTSGNLT